jgi:N utilization substance protein A
VANALAPAKLSKIEVEEETMTVTVTVDSDQLSLAIGKRGQNARLTAKLTGWRVDIQRDEESLSFEEKVQLAISRLAGIEAVGEERADRLVQAGFLTMEGILAADIEDLSSVEGFDEEAALAVHKAVEEAYEAEHGVLEEK